MSNKNIQTMFKKLKEQAFEIALKTFAAIGNLGKAARDLKVRVKVQNLVETHDDLRKLSILAEKTWLELFAEKKRCQVGGFPINTEVDIIFTIKSVEKGLSIEVQSKYIKKETSTEEGNSTFTEFVDDANKIIDEVLGRDRSMIIEKSIISQGKNRQIIILNEFFKKKLSRIFFAVLVKKFTTEVKNLPTS